MHENNFEDQVHDKMQQLGFDPSDAVWSGIDKEINKERKRKPLFWLFFFSGLTLAGIAFYMGTLNRNPNNASVKQQEVLKNPTLPNQAPSQIQPEGKHANNQIAKKKIEYSSSDIARSKISHKLIAENSDEERQQQPNNSQLVEATINKKNDFQTVKKDSSAELAKTKDPKTSSVKKRWLFGITIDAGLSKVKQSLFNTTNVAGAYFSTNPNYFAPGNIAGPAAYAPSTAINPGFSYGFGVVADRYLSDRIYISAGLNYHYYSTTMHTGDFMNNSPASYQNGNTRSYINKYHFTDLPVMVGFQINKSKKTPLFWEAGLSVSYLLSSTTLQFDPYTDLYYQNTALFNNFQLNGITSLKIGMHIHHVELQLGPQFQYGITGLFKQNSTAEQAHLFYGGIAITIIPLKK